MRKLLLASIAILAAIPAYATTIDVGYWNQTSPNTGVVPLYHQDTFNLFTLQGNIFGGSFAGVLSALRTPDGFYEAAINDIFSVGNLPATSRLYVSFSGVTFTGDNDLTFPMSLWQRGENTLPGWTLAEQTYICGNGNLFCDNYINPTGEMIGNHHWTGGSTGTVFENLTGNAPSNPFTITEVFHIVSDGVQQAHMAGAIWAQPVSQVPGPIAGAGLPGLAALGMWLLWRRRRGQTS